MFLNGNSLLHITASKGHMATFTYLLTETINIYEKNSEGMTPFHIAALYGHTNIIQYLHNNKYEINRNDSKTNHFPTEILFFI